MQLTFSGAYIEKVRKKIFDLFFYTVFISCWNQLSLIIKKTAMVNMTFYSSQITILENIWLDKIVLEESSTFWPILQLY